MKIKNVIGDNSPEVVTEDEVVKYEYKQLFTTETNVYKLEKVKTRMLVKIYQDYLDDTDHKFYGDYEPKVGEDLEAIEATRDEYREFIRANEVEV